VLGHEGCGEITTIGSSIPKDSPAAGLKVGDRVAMNPVAGCDDKACPDCGTGFPQLCQSTEGSHHGLGQDGSFAQYVAISHRSAIPVPAGVSAAEAAVATDAVMTSHHAIVTRAKITAKDTVFQFGLGGLGMNAVQILLRVGCTLYVNDVRQGPLDEAVKLGVPANNVVPVGTSVQEWVKEKGLEGRIDKVVDFVGLQQTFSDAEVIGTSSPHFRGRKAIGRRLSKPRPHCHRAWKAIERRLVRDAVSESPSSYRFGGGPTGPSYLYICKESLANEEGQSAAAAP